MSTRERNDDTRELEAWLSRSLRDSADYIEDEGFTGGVMDRISASSAENRRLWPWVLLGAVLVGALSLLLASLVVPAQSMALGLASLLTVVPLAVWLQAGAGMLVLVMALTGYWVWKEE